MFLKMRSRAPALRVWLLLAVLGISVNVNYWAVQDAQAQEGEGGEGEGGDGGGDGNYDPDTDPDDPFYDLLNEIDYSSPDDFWQSLLAFCATLQQDGDIN